MDLVEDFALPLSIGVICELLGVPPQDRTRSRTWGDARLSTSALTADEIAESTAQLHKYVALLLAHRRESPAEDLISALIAAQSDGDQLSEQELVELCVTLLFAGYEATSTQIPNFVYFLLQLVFRTSGTGFASPTCPGQLLV